MTINYPFLFLLGRPGCGKSVIYEMLTEQLKKRGLAREFMRIDDFPILKELLDKDIHCARHRKKAGGFEVTDWTIVDEVLEVINAKIKKLAKPDRLIFVEFARGSYLDALKNFDREVLAKSLILYIFAPYEVCCQRNIKRFKERREGDLDDHIVPPDLMESYYKEDDFEKLLLVSQERLQALTPATVLVIDSQITGRAKLAPEIDRVAKLLEDINKEKKE
jgi:adenylate kinase family enzyme